MVDPQDQLATLHRTYNQLLDLLARDGYVTQQLVEEINFHRSVDCCQLVQKPQHKTFFEARNVLRQFRMHFQFLDDLFCRFHEPERVEIFLHDFMQKLQLRKNLAQHNLALSVQTVNARVSD